MQPKLVQRLPPSIICVLKVFDATSENVRVRVRVCVRDARLQWPQHFFMVRRQMSYVYEGGRRVIYASIWYQNECTHGSIVPRLRLRETKCMSSPILCGLRVWCADIRPKLVLFASLLFSRSCVDTAGVTRSPSSSIFPASARAPSLSAPCSQGPTTNLFVFAATATASTAW